MASLFGMIKRLFGGGSGHDQGAQDQVKQTQVNQGQVADNAEPAGQSEADPVMTLQEDVVGLADSVSDGVEEVVDSVVAVTTTRGQYVAEQAAEFVEDVSNTASDATSDVIAGAQQDAADITAEVGQAAEGVAEAAGVERSGDGVPVEQLPLEAAPKAVNRDEFNLPRSEVVAKAMQTTEAKHGKKAVGEGLRIYEYSMAAAIAHDWRVDRELLLVASLFVNTGADAADRAKSFAMDAGMWDALAKRIGEFISWQGSATSADEPETRALSLGVAAEAAGGDVPYVNAATAAETRARNSV